MKFLLLMLMLASYAYGGQATLPKALEDEGAIGAVRDLKAGQSGYTSCHGLSADMNRLLWVHGATSVWRQESDLLRVKLNRTSSGVAVSMIEPCCVKILEELNPQRYLPVEEFQCLPKPKSWFPLW